MNPIFKKNIAIIGAGIAGLTLANKLKDSAKVTVFEKSRGIGGRMSTRYTEAYCFDHGAQYFTAMSENFRHFLEPFIHEGSVAEWKPNIAHFGGKNLRTRFQKARRSASYERDTPLYIGVPNMNSLCKAMTRGFEVNLDTKVKTLIQSEKGWQIVTETERTFESFDWVISTAPADQTKLLFPYVFSGFKELNSVKMTSAISVMLGFEQPIQIPFDAAIIENSPIDWISVNSRKPGRNSSLSVVVQMDPEWSEEHFQDTTESLTQIVLNELVDVTGVKFDNSDFKAAHHWRYAEVSVPAGTDFIIDRHLGLATCGDGCLGSGVENAFLSADRLAQNLRHNIL